MVTIVAHVKCLISFRCVQPKQTTVAAVVGTLSASLPRHQRIFIPEDLQYLSSNDDVAVCEKLWIANNGNID